VSSKAKIETAKRTLKDLNKEENDVEAIEIDTKGENNINDDENDENASKRFQQEDFDDWRYESFFLFESLFISFFGIEIRKYVELIAKLF
jgi:hypothetical protein